MMIKSDRKSYGFTIIELLVVIVVIGILTGLSLVGYSSISSQAVASSLKADLTTAASKLELYKWDVGAYPASLDGNYCPPSQANSKYCLDPSIGNTYAYSSSYPHDTFSLDATSNNGTKYRVTNNSSPVAVVTTAVTAIAAITGTTNEGQMLTAGALTPSNATVSYQWQSAATSGGSYSNISGATASTYVLVSGDVGKYIKVVATGTGDSNGSVTSTASSVIIASSDPTITIGTQVWMQYNLNVGTMVTSGQYVCGYDEYTEQDITCSIGVQTNNSVIEKFCYNNDEGNCTIYGGFYQWDEAMQYVTTNGAQGICPAGSHIPSDNDWKILEVQLGMTQPQTDATGWRGTDQGTKLMSGGSSGLNVPLAGRRMVAGGFDTSSSTAYLWSSSESGAEALYRRLAPDVHTTVDRSAWGKDDGFSVRCLRN